MPTVMRPGAATTSGTIVALLACLAVGCGSPQTVITGTVTLDGQPVANAILDMFPVSAIGRVTVARTDAEGRYRATVSPGKLSVVVLAQEPVGTVREVVGLGPIADMKSVVPHRYTLHAQTPLFAQPVEGRTTNVDLRLSGDN
jgi:hypothetical protein